MAESNRLVDLVQEGLDSFFDARAVHLEGIGAEFEPFIDYSRDLLSGGKRFRALFCYWGWRAVTSAVDQLDPLGDEHGKDQDAVVRAAVSLELFHAAALVHDDIIDNSDTRRGGTAMHRRFEHAHRDNAWAGSAEMFGRSAAILLGDLLLAWSDEAFDEALALTASDSARKTARREFNRMRTEVMLGQYLDVLDEQSWMSHPESEHLGRAHRVVVYKSAKYSVEAPLVIGAALGGASESELDGLREFGLPLGIAYQLRDDLLGVFGDTTVTGKPSGGDLREGKRTVLVAIGRAKLPASARRFVDELLGDPDLSEIQVQSLQETLRSSGAVDDVENLIARETQRAAEALQELDIASSAREQLHALIASVSRRSS